MMKKVNFADMMTVIIRTVFVFVLVASFTSCSKDTWEEIEGELPVSGEFTFTNDQLAHDPAFTCNLYNGSALDNMTSSVTVTRNNQTNTFENAPYFEAKAKVEGEKVLVMENYTLNLHGFTAAKDGEADVYNNGDFYERTEDWKGHFYANDEKVNLTAKNIDFAKFFSANEKVLQLPATTIDSLTLAGYTIHSISDEVVDGKKTVTFKVMARAYRTPFGAEKVTANQLRTRSSVTRASNQIISPVELFLTASVNAGVNPTDEYTGFGNVRQEVKYNWDKMVVEVKVLADEYYTLSGTKTVVVEETELPFGLTASGKNEYVSENKNLKEGSKSSDVNSDNEVNRRQKHTMTNTYGMSLSEVVCNKVFTFWWTTGYTEKDGTRIDFDIATPTQVYAGYAQVSETSDNTYKTITTYDVKNTITFGGSKTNASQIVIKVKKDEEKPVTVTNVELSQTKVEEQTRTKITVTADITYSDGTTAKRDTVVYRAHGASNASPINVTKAKKSVVYVSNNVTSGTSNGKINYTNAVTLRYVDNSTDVMNFSSYQEEAGSITFWGKTIALQVATMVPSYVSLVEGATSESGNYNVTTWTVNAKSVIGAATLPQTGIVKVSVEKEEEYIHPTKGKLIGAMASYSACKDVSTKLWDVMILVWENVNTGEKGYEIETDGTMQSKFWKASEIHPSITVTSATSKGPNGWMPSNDNVNTKDGYWTWVTKDANGNQYYSSFPYKMYPQYQNNPNYCKRSVTCEFVGNKMNVIENGVVIRSYNRN